MLSEGGQEPGDGPGWKMWKIKNNKEKGIEEGRCKTKQRELYQVGSGSQWLSFDELKCFDGRRFELSFGMCLPDIILIDPYDEGSRSV